jgi:predicted esterase
MRPLALLFAPLFLLACSSTAEEARPEPAPVPDATIAQEGTEPPPGEPPPVTKPADDPGPAPAGCSDIQADGDGFFTRSSGAGDYVGFVPKSYGGQPLRLLVGLHGCGDEAYNFATWAVSPWATRETQDYIGISIDGASGGGNCWKAADEAKVLAAIDDVATCFYVHKQKVVLAGFSSGGMLAYGMGLKHAERFAGLLVENAALGSDQALASASWKLNVAHMAHTEDSVFPIARVRSDWAKLRGAGFPLETQEVPGGHDGTSEDWTGWLIPQMAAWKIP